MQLLIYLVVIALLWSFGCYLAAPESAPGQLFGTGERIFLSAWFVGAMPHFQRGDEWRAPLYLVGVCCWMVAERMNGAMSGWSLLVFWSSVALVLLQVETGLAVLLRRPRLVAVATAWLPVFFIIVPVMLLSHWHVFGEGVGTAAVMAVLQSNPRESIDFVRQFVGWDRIAVLAAFSLMILSLAVFSGFRQALLARLRHGVASLSLAAAVIVVAWTGSAGSPFFHMVESSASRYFTELARFQALYQARQSGLIRVEATHPGSRATWILVIGESHSGRHMGINGYWRDTTPNLSAIKDHPRLVWLDNAYSNHTHTVPALTLALTSANQYNGREVFREPSIIEVARAAGFRTYWISNQVRYGAWDSAVTVLADQADEVIYENENVGATTRTSVHDEALIIRLRRVLERDDVERKLVVIHLMGSHAFYCSRYPRDHATYTESGSFYWGRATAESRDLNCYDNSVRYNDHVMGEIVSSASGDPDFAGLFFFADHGESVASGKGHNSAVFSHDMSEIPAWFWFSEDIASNPAVDALSDNRARVFTNDLVYDTLVGLMGIKTPAYDPEYDLSSSRYALSPARAKLLHGEHDVDDDPMRREARFLRQFEQRTLLAHRVNTLAKLGEALSRGYPGVETDLYLTAREDGFYYEVGHDREHLSGGTLGDMLNTIEDVMARSFTAGPPERIWLDVKNLDSGNVGPALARLQELHRRYPWFKDAALVETSLVDDSIRVIAEAGWHLSYYLPTGRVLELQAANDRKSMRALAAEIAAQAERQRLEAVSFDQRLYPFVRDYLEERLPPGVVYHAWDLAIRPVHTGAPQLLSERPWVHDQRLKTLIVPMASDFDL